MPTNENKRQYDMQYAKDKLKRIPLNVQKEKYGEIKAAAEAAGEPINGYIKKAIDERMEREKLLPEVPATSNIKEAEPLKKSSDHISQSDTPVHETLNEKLKRLRRTHLTQMPISSNE